MQKDYELKLNTQLWQNYTHTHTVLNAFYNNRLNIIRRKRLKYIKRRFFANYGGVNRK